MARVARTVRIGAPAADVWSTITDVEGWPAWAPQMTRLDWLEGAPMRLGSRVRVRPKGLPPATWHVTEYDEGRSFTWTSTLLPGVRVAGGHVLTPLATATEAEFWLETSGPIGVLAGPILERTVFKRNTRNATDGLKRYVEARREAAVTSESPDHAT